MGVPGEIYGFYEEWKLFGRVPWSRLFIGAIRICEEGFRVEKALSVAIANSETVIRADQNWRYY